MKLSKYLINFLWIGLIGSSLSGAYFIARNIEPPIINVTKQQSSLNLDNNFLRYLNLGQKRLYSSLFWISTILESDQEHYKGKNLNSWMFLRFQTISLLEPKFYENYAFGGLYLSVIKDDLEGASEIYSKGLKIYPNDYNLLKNAAFHFYYEAQDYTKAEVILRQLKTHPKVNPTMISSLARIESQNGNLEDAYKIILESYNSLNDKNDFLGQKIYSNLYAIKSEMDLKCLNNHGMNCSLVDFDKNSYLKNADGIYQAQKKWIPFRIKTKKR
jgi:tetratricopeptide (TPR) repeat protein